MLIRVRHGRVLLWQPRRTILLLFGGLLPVEHARKGPVLALEIALEIAPEIGKEVVVVVAAIVVVVVVVVIVVAMTGGLGRRVRHWRIVLKGVRRTAEGSGGGLR